MPISEPRATLVEAPERRSVKVAYIMSRFPKLTETFILYEVVALRRQGVDVELWPLLRERTSVMHPDAEPLVREANYLPFVSPAILRSVAWFLLRRPAALLAAVATVVRECWGSANFLVGAAGILPKAVHAARLMEQRGVTHVHCHFATHPAVAGFVIHRLTGIPYSFVAHGSDLHVDRHMLRRKLAEADFAVAISEENRRTMLEECGDEHAAKIRVIHCGVDTDVFVPARDPGDTAALQILSVGTLHEVKGQTHLVRACEILSRRGIDFVCRFVGDGPDRAALEKQAAAAGLAGKVEFAGPLPRADVVRLMRASDVLAAPSVPTRKGKREGIPTVLMEAMSSGLPVVASRLSGIPELVDDGVNGLLVAPGDADGLAAALERLQRDPSWRGDLGRGARRTVEERFDLARNARAVASHFRGGTAA